VVLPPHHHVPAAVYLAAPRAVHPASPEAEERMYFGEPGQQNTRAALKIAKEEAQRRSVRHLVVATTTGETGIMAAELLQGTDIELICVTHNTGFKEPGSLELPPETKKRIEELGGKILTCPMVLRSLGGAIRKKYGYSEQQLVADVLRMFGQGMKVCVEIAAMAADAGLVPPSEVIAVAGTSSGADTVVLLHVDSSNRFFDIKIREILAKPSEF
jgi:hypothetical protein